MDLYSCDGLTVDEEGQLFDTPERLRREAVRILPDIIRDEMLDGDGAVVTVKVRDESGNRVLVASLVISTQWCD
ncbi:DUF6894 family protein [Mesorhizobium qingshengii]|uniref:DUF6894 domain-containing protein n=1 Tax=Mesorhizobium qingshengii TaxID=1165689 RepID=A0A1G5XMZ7_9HYPH|nr:hypothetical protein [Mesorhizobium qingshengii]SDA71859.1 hypothetical protein SAMN02927914_02481 [Mesorhizobium qingshengii]